MVKPWLLVALLVVTASCRREEATDATGSAPATSEVPVDEPVEEARPEGSVVPIVSTGDDELRDLIRPGDPAASYCLADLGIGPGEFYDKDADVLVFPESTSFFEARFDDGSTVEIRIHPELVDNNGSAQADRIAQPIALLPVELRSRIERVGFLPGESTAQADGGGEGIHVYSGNVMVRENAQRFEETIFHESVHTSLDDELRETDGWRTAQQSDPGFLTAYAADNPATEDLAETALYAWALTHYPERISAADAEAWAALAPARIAFIERALSPPGQGYAPTEPSCRSL